MYLANLSVLTFRISKKDPRVKNGIIKNDITPVDKNDIFTCGIAVLSICIHSVFHLISYNKFLIPLWPRAVASNSWP